MTCVTAFGQAFGRTVIGTVCSEIISSRLGYQFVLCSAWVHMGQLTYQLTILIYRARPYVVPLVMNIFTRGGLIGKPCGRALYCLAWER